MSDEMVWVCQEVTERGERKFFIGAEVVEDDEHEWEFQGHHRFADNIAIERWHVPGTSHTIVRKHRWWRCAWCGCRMIAHDVQGRLKYCRDSCKEQAVEERRQLRQTETHSKRCAVCDETFLSKRSDAKTCSEKCRKRMQRLNAA